VVWSIASTQVCVSTAMCGETAGEGKAPIAVIIAAI